MQRRRAIAAAPARPAAAAWRTIVELVADTLDQSPVIERADVVAAMAVADELGPRLVAGRHLETQPLVVVADPVHLSIYTVSGAGAVVLEENLNAVPGGASATTWTVHFPVSPPLTDEVKAAVAGVPHLSAESAPATKAASRAPLVDLDALARQMEQGRL